jgi:hypothetical protein
MEIPEELAHDFRPNLGAHPMGQPISAAEYRPDETEVILD